ncbi:MAG: hypothetical protein JO340_10180 [Acidobacteriaceae bacterium]|nr:hypothetical protein [Acidobacteriaceae bacterium]
MPTEFKKEWKGAASVPENLPSIAHHVGRVVGASFDPENLGIRIKTQVGETLDLTATEDQVDRALALRAATVIAVAVEHGASHRLLIVQDANEPIDQSTRDIAVFERWSGLLEQLAK